MSSKRVRHCKLVSAKAYACYCFWHKVKPYTAFFLFWLGAQRTNVTIRKRVSGLALNAQIVTMKLGLVTCTANARCLNEGKLARSNADKENVDICDVVWIQEIELFSMFSDAEIGQSICANSAHIRQIEAIQQMLTIWTNSRRTGNVTVIANGTKYVWLADDDVMMRRSYKAASDKLSRIVGLNIGGYVICLW